MSDATPIERLEAAIAAQEALRPLLGDATVDTTIAALRAQLAALSAAAPAPPPAEDEGERRLITALFADVVGSTSLAESMDVEDWLGIIDGAYREMSQAVERYGGRVLQLLGDGILAIFGVPVGREDDAERAVRAALDMQAGIARYAAELKARQQLAFAIRVGVHTGMAIVQPAGEGYRAVGDTLNLASRLQSAAPPGRVLVSHATYRHVRGVFNVQPLGPLVVAGKQKPVAAYLVGSEKARAFRFSPRVVEGVETSMIGRDAELATLVTATEDAVRTGRLHWVTVTGEPGVGKSRLLYEYEKYVELLPQTFTYFKGRSAPDRRHAAYGLLRDCLAFRCGINLDDPRDVAHAKLVAGLRELWGPGAETDAEAEEAIALVGHLLGYDFADSPHLRHILGDTGQIRDRAFHALDRLFERASVRRPVALLLEDLHWADDASLEALGYVLQRSSARPFVALTAARPEFLEDRPRWGRGLETGRVVLSPLALDDGRALVRDILQRADAVPAELEDFIATRAEGNPYFVEELVKFLIERSVITVEVNDGPGDERWHVHLERLAAASVPPTLVGLLQARIDSLPGEERALLQRAAVIGRIFWRGAAAALAGDAPPDGEALDAGLAGLARRELIFRRTDSTFAGEQEYAFKHALLRDVAYESVLRRQRAGYHRAVAEWLLARAGARAGEFAALIAGHYEACGANEEAIRYYRTAGHGALAAGANREAAGHFSRALALAPEYDRELAFELLLGREQAYNLLVAREPQGADLERLLELAEELDDDARRALAYNRRAWYAEVGSDYPGVIEAARAALAAAERAGDERAAVESLNRWGRAYWRRDEYAAARERLEVALARARANGDAAGEAFSLKNLGSVYDESGEYDQARAHASQALALYRAIGDREGEATVLNSLGNSAQQMGDYATARTAYEAALAIHRATGNRYGEAIASGNLALGDLAQGELERARRNAERALDICRATDNRRGVGYSLTYLARVLEAQGDLDGAEAAYAEALALRGQLGQRALAIEDVAGLGRVALARGDRERAVAAAREALAYVAAHGLDGIEFPFGVYASCLAILEQAGAAAEAQAAAEAAYTQLMARAERIADPALRRSFLENVAEHREIVWRYLAQV